MNTRRTTGKTASAMAAAAVVVAVVVPLVGCTHARTNAAHKASPPQAHSRRVSRTDRRRRTSRSYVPKLVLGRGPLFGIYQPKLPRSRDVTAAITGKLHPEIIEIYTKFGAPFESRAARTNYAHGAMTLVQLDPWTVPLYRIASGEYDGYLRRYARAVAKLRFRIGFSFAHEMNGEWYPWDFRKGGPAHFVAAWRRIHRVFASMHATNVTWVWTINKLYLRNSRMIAQVTREDWPGQRYVDWVGVDGYFRFPGEDFARVVTPTLRLIRTLTRKPVLLAETAVYPNSLRDLQLRELFAGIARDHLLGFIYFDANARRKWSLHGRTTGQLTRLLRSYRYKELACHRRRHICMPAARPS
jgi:mannan endo-1,4-beta-mannosidase